MLEMIELPYPLNALEPFYDRETLDLHYNVLYKGYVDNTNKTKDSLRKAVDARDFSNIKCLEKNLSFFGSGVILHELFFGNMGPKMFSSPSASLMEQITKDFGSFGNFKSQFEEAAINIEASRMVFISMGSKME